MDVQSMGAELVPEQSYTKPKNVIDLACRLIDLGYFPVPIPPGCKGPTIQGWQNLHMTKAEAVEYFAQPGMLIGILHKNNCFIDIDVYDPELAEIIAAEARTRFPGCLERVGQYPKTAIVLGMDEVGFKVGNTIRAEQDIDGKIFTAQVEIRTLTRQAVVYGRHPETQDYYKWMGRELWETPQAELPRPTKDEVQEFRDWADKQIREWANITDETSQNNVISIGVFHKDTFGNDEASEEQFLAALKYFSSDTNYEDWLQGLMAIHDFYKGSASGLSIAKEWSAASPDYTPQEVEQKWRSFEVGRGTSYRSVFHYARQNGADLSEIARIGREPAQPLQIATTPAPTISADSPQEEIASPIDWFIDVDPILTESYLVKGVLAQAAMSVVYGPSNSGKTFFALDLAYHIAAGAEWRSHRVRGGAVLYLAAEGGNGVANRIAALRKERGGGDIPLALRRAGLDLLQSEADLQHVYDLALEVQARAPDRPLLVVVDTLSRVMAGGDENSASDMTALIRNIDAIREATGAHIMIIHHSGKDTARGARGHSSLRAATDTEIEVQNTETEEGEQFRAAQVSKQRDYPGGETFAFGLSPVALGVDQDGDDVSSCVVEVLDAADFKAAKSAAHGLGGNQKIIADTFRQLVGEGLARPNPGGVGFPEPGHFWCVDLSVLRDHAMGKFTSNSPRTAWNQAMTALTDKRGLFCVADEIAWRTDMRIR